jgi:hypothetical protein
VKLVGIALLLGTLVLSGCALGKKMLEQPSGHRETSPVLQKQTETFTGKVVLDDGAYRFKLLKDGSLLRLSRARRESEFASEQINLRKYYEKTLDVRGTRAGDWIWAADIIAQYTPPGGDTGPNMNAPKPTRP